MQGYTLKVDADAIALVTFDLPGKVNVMNDDFMSAMEELLGRLERQRSSLHGVILTSAKSTFFAGGDLAFMARAEKGQEEFLFSHYERLKSYFRRLEKLGLPVVAAINGTALGGGFELCLACHRRIAVLNPKAVIGLPEVSFGILPAAGGVIRLTGLLGLTPALEFLTTGQKVDVQTALKRGLVDQVVKTVEEMMAEARAWILSGPKPVQPWDRPRELGSHQLPGAVRAELAGLPVWLGRRVDGKDRAAMRIADIAAESLFIDFDTASRIETRGFVELVLGPTAKQRIAAFFDPLGARVV